jgi:hypothetical protein
VVERIIHKFLCGLTPRFEESCVFSNRGAGGAPHAPEIRGAQHTPSVARPGMEV